MKSKSSAEKINWFNTRLPWLWVVVLPALVIWTSTTSYAQSCAPTPSGLVSWWRGENNTSDQNSNNNGSLIGNTGYGSGKVGNAFVFDGDHDAVSVGNPANLQLQNFTIEAWVKRTSSTVATLAPEAFPGTGAIFCYSWGGYGLYLLDDGHIGLGKIGYSSITSTVLLTDTNSFHHVTVTKSGGSIVFYLDGVADAVAGAYDPGFSFDGPAAIGARGSDWVGTLFGSVDEVSVYNRALSTAEVQAVHQSGITGKCTSPTAPFVYVQPTPTNQTVLEGSSVGFSVTAGGSTPLSYQWRKNSTAVNGATNTTLSFANVSTGDAADYDVVITNNSGSVTSVVATLSVTPNLTACVGPPSGLVSWWRGESNGDDSSSTNNGTLQGGLNASTGEVGQAFSFNGSDQYVSVPASTSLNVGSIAGLTLECWIKPSDVSNPRPIAEWNDGSGTVRGMHFWISVSGSGALPGAVYANLIDTAGNYHQISTAGGLIGTASFSHLALTYDHATGMAVLYCNGLVVASQNIGVFTPQTSYPLYLGKRTSGDGAGIVYSGLMDEVSLYSRALSSVEIQAIYSAGSAGKCLPTPPCASAPSGLVSWWRGEANANDTISGLNGTLQSGATFLVGKVNQAFSLDGVDDYVQVGNRPELVMSNAMTVDAWIYPTGPGSASDGAGIILNKEGEYLISRNSNGTIRFAIKDPGSPLVWTVTPLVAPLNTWTHVALTYGSSSIKIYGNGTLIQSYAGPSTIGDELPGQDDFRIGGRQYIAENFKGLIDEASVYRTALTAGDIAAIYNAGSAGKCGPPIAPFVIVQPADQTVFEGSPAAFSVTAGGTSPLSYQWRKNSTAVNNATNTTLSFGSVSTNDAGGYDVVITNSVGSVTSLVATLTVNQATCVNPPSGIVGWWRGENNSDEPIGGLSGTLVGGATFAAGKVGQAFSLDGVDDYVQIGNRPELVMSNAMAIEAWIYPTGSGSGPGGEGIIVNKEGEYEIDRTPDGTIRFSIKNPGAAMVWTVTPLVAPLNTWTHVALTYGASAIKIYGNGALLQTYAGPSTIGDELPGLQDFRIGGRQAVSENFKGLIDEVSVYRTALTAGDIAAIYNAGSFGKCIVPVAPFITSQPASNTVTAGANVTFNVGAGGSPPLSYQWLHNNTNVVANATNSSLTLNNVQVSQAGAYSVVVTNPVSSVTSSNAILTVNYPTAIVRVRDTNVASGATFSVPVQLAANGNENAVGFTLNFSTSRVSYVEVTLGSGAAGGSLLVNSSEAVSGRVGVAVALPTDATFAAGTQEVVRVSFTAAIVTSDTSTALSFGDVPIVRQLSDAPGNALPVNFTSGNVLIAAAEYEGDVSPRPNGSKTVTITDWVLVGRYAALLDAPTNSSEFQRADCAPRLTLGNGALTVSDWVQAGRYAALFDPPTVAGGPTSGGSGLVLSSLRSSGGSGPANLTGRQVMASSSSLLQGDTTTVSVNLVSQGDENALSFSLGFDPAALNYTGTTLGSGTSGATLNVNTNQIGAGRIGFILALPNVGHFIAGTQETVKVNFKSVSTAAGSFAVNLIDLPLVREVSSTNAIALDTSYVNGNVVLNPPPSLRIAHSGPDVTLAWPSWAVNFGLQVSDSAAPLSANWTNLVATPSVINNENVVSQPLGGATKFYRLFRP